MVGPISMDGLAMKTRRFLAGLWPSCALPVVGALLALCAHFAPALADVGAEPGALTADQRAIIDKIAKPSQAENLQFAGAPTDLIGARVRLPFREGTHITLVRTGTTVLKDGSVTWRGEVEETGERAVLMLWSNALLTGYFAYKGTVFTVESLGGGVSAFLEMDRRQIPADHPEPGGRIDSVPGAPAAEPTGPRAPIPEPKIEP